ncbi:hypothetical protein FrCorBMG51_20460 [Protofrankia coriariae]|uniref:DUF2795 domain-containing protein n=1 Tax=Protofrankia coriariae TaxID=1562887 RepID=A0ABR5F051_9ACTN|nr:hypothetical protein FrCorBMG51_20460 [Protofrankia coriariae]
MVAPSRKTSSRGPTRAPGLVDVLMQLPGLAHRVHTRQLREIVEEYEREHGPLDIDGVQDALAEWPDI